MQRIDNRTVVLTHDEEHVSDEFDALLDQGLNIAEAVGRLRPDWPQLGQDFWDWLLTC